MSTDVENAGAAEQRPFGAGLDHDVGDQPGKADVVRPDGQEYEIEAARRRSAPGASQQRAQLGQLRRHRGRAGRVAAVELATALRVEQTAIDGGAGAGERQERHRDVRSLDGERERGAQLITVERAMARPVHPPRREHSPLAPVAAAIGAVAALVTGETDAAGAEIFGGADAEEAAEAEPLVGERHRAIRVAVARRDGVAEPGDQEIAHGDRGAGATHRFAGRRDIDRCRRWFAVACPQRYRLGAGGACGMRHWLVRGHKAPAAGRVRRDEAAEPHLDAMIRRVEIAFPHPVAHALVGNSADRVEAQAHHHGARPATAVGGLLQRMFGLKRGVPARRLDVTAKIALVAEQAEPVDDLPVDHNVGGGFWGHGIGRAELRHVRRARLRRLGSR